MVYINGKSNNLKIHLGEKSSIKDPQIEKLVKTLRTMSKEYMLDFDIRQFR